MSAVVVVLLVVIVALALAVAVVLGLRRRAIRSVQDLVVDLQPDAPRRRDEALEQALERLARAVHRERDGADRSEIALNRMTTAIDALPVGVVVADDEGTPVLRNDAARHFAGTHHADALVLDAVAAMLRAARRDGAQHRTLELYGPPRRTVAVDVAPFSGGAVAVVEDLTERVRLESMRRDFVANISHELKTPVGALALLAETLSGEDEPDVVDRLAQRMVLESHRVGRIIDDLLELSRIEVGEAPVREVVEVGPLATGAVERVRPLADDRGIRIAIDARSRRLSVLGDRRQLASALANLVENGVKYSDAGSSVEVSARLDGEGRWVELVVRDHGIGIPARDLERVFERFYRVDRARARETGGTGLGLAIVRHVATNHAGTVVVQSQEGVGSTFTMRLPAGPVLATAEASVGEQGAYRSAVP